jgi:hypothetical protein
MIEEYISGDIIVNGVAYQNDIMSDWKENVSEWESEDEMGLRDLIPALEKNPEAIVVGTGEDENISVARDVFDYLRQKGIKLVVDRTREAVRTFNILKENSFEEEGRQCRVVGFFHLT